MLYQQIINCTDPDWREALKGHLEQGREVDLIQFEYCTDGELCETLARDHAMLFKLDAKQRAGFFRRRHT